MAPRSLRERLLASLCAPHKTGFQPQVGFYSSLSNAVIAQHMATMASNDIDVVGVEWTGPGKYEEENTLREGGVLDAASDAGLKVALLYDLTIAHDGSTTWPR